MSIYEVLFLCPSTYPPVSEDIPAPWPLNGFRHSEVGTYTQSNVYFFFVNTTLFSADVVDN
jgi:hypothetical protein